MADISKCTGQNCPLKDTCYRYTSPKSMVWQSYLGKVPYDHTKKECEFYWKV